MEAPAADDPLCPGALVQLHSLDSGMRGSKCRGRVRTIAADLVVVQPLGREAAPRLPADTLVEIGLPGTSCWWAGMAVVRSCRDDRIALSRPSLRPIQRRRAPRVAARASVSVAVGNGEAATAAGVTADISVGGFAARLGVGSALPVGSVTHAVLDLGPGRSIATSAELVAVDELHHFTFVGLSPIDEARIEAFVSTRAGVRGSAGEPGNDPRGPAE